MWLSFSQCELGRQVTLWKHLRIWTSQMSLIDFSSYLIHDNIQMVHNSEIVMKIFPILTKM